MNDSLRAADRDREVAAILREQYARGRVVLVVIRVANRHRVVGRRAGRG